MLPLPYSLMIGLFLKAILIFHLDIRPHHSTKKYRAFVRSLPKVDLFQ